MVPVGFDSLRAFATREWLAPAVLGIAGILSRSEHVAIVAPSCFGVLAKGFEVAVSELEYRKLHPVALSLPVRDAILVEDGQNV